MNYKYNLVIADIETTAIENFSTLDCPIKFHCLSILDVKAQEMHEFNTVKDNIEDGIEMLKQSKYVCGHNFIGFDAPCIEKLYGVKLNKIVDTMLMSKLFCRDLKIMDMKRENFPSALMGRHSLKAWGWRLGNFKGDHGEKEGAWDSFTPEMQQYCSQDVRVTYDLYNHLVEMSVSSQSLELEHDFARLIRVQEMNGFPFDVEKGEQLAKLLTVRRVQLEKEMQKVFPPKRKRMKSVTGWKVEFEGIEYKAKTKVQLRCELKKAGVKQSIVEFAEKMGNKTKTTPFNPGSRDQIAERLMEQGWVPKAYEGKRPEINETVLKGINTKESLKLLEYLLVQKRLGMLAEGKNAWLNSVTKKGRIHSNIHTAGTISGRCSSSNPNLQQIPAVRSEYGKECRELFKAPEGKVLTGCDASGLELRALASFLYQFDSGKFTREILEGDIHQLNSDILGIDRDNSKTFIYSLIYGASNQRLGEAVGKGMKEGKRLRDTFMAKMPAFKKLLSAIERAVAVKGHLVGVDGRAIEVRSKHSLLNFLLQSCGAVIMKQALVEFAKLAKHPYEMHANVHDEVQFSCLEEHSDELGKAFVAAIVKAGEVLDIKCPLDGDYKVGNNWAETH